MTARVELTVRARELDAARTPFVWATVVRAERPTSAKPGDAALVLSDGRIEGFVGGSCAESTVRAQALEVLTDGRTRLLRITPDAQPEAEDDRAGLVTVVNPCLSGGTLEIFLEPALPLPLVLVFGEGPIARALERASGVFDHQVRLVTDPAAALPPDAAAVVAASHGRGEEQVLTAALRAGVPYVGLVASHRRGAAVVGALEVDPALRGRVHTPAGIDIGAVSPGTVALSILAEIVALRPGRPTGEDVAAVEPPPTLDLTAVDPVCRMKVAAVDASVHADLDGVRVWFCGPGCRDAYVSDPSLYPS